MNDLSSLPLSSLQALEADLARALAEQSLYGYKPYPKQLEFHAAGATHRERLLRAGNQQGKTLAVGCEAAYHLTGRYPDWWPGRRWSRPIVMWASGETSESTRDNPQRVLIGQVGEFGIGAIPKNCLGEYGLATGTADLYDYVKAKHFTNGKFDGWSLVRFKHYAQGRKKWQGPPVDFVWFDEEPDEEIYDEGLARTIATDGMAALSFTPLQGMSSVVARFLLEDNPARHDTNMTIEDAEHIPVEDRERIIASFKPHEREARARGVPTMGSGRIFPVEESAITVESFQIPVYWPRIKGMDFGWDHPTAMVELALDRDTDTIYVTHTYRRKEATPVLHAAAINSIDNWVPVAWPHDGNNDTAAGPNLAKQYRDAGVNMLNEHAQFAETPGQDDKPQSRVSVEAGLAEMLDRMETNRWKVFSHLNDWFEEYRLYHRKDGKIVKLRDDLLSASRYACMCLRYAETQPKKQDWREGRTFNWRAG